MQNKISGNIPVIVIFAPTASGKTALMRDLFSPVGSPFNLTPILSSSLKGKAEVISADSMAVYKELNIGTAKPDEEFCREIPHHLINMVSYKNQFSVADFVTNADIACCDIWNRGKIPVVAGGTGFYIRAFLLGLPETPESDPVLRKELKERCAVEGKEIMYQELCEKDPESAKKIHPNDEYRILRALEVYYLTGKPRSSFCLSTEFRKGYDFCPVFLEPPRDLLFERIGQRVEVMFQNGLSSEVSDLKKQGAKIEDPGIQAIGYREFFLSDDQSEIKEMIIHNSCKYAKKQYTYIRDLPKSTTLQYTGIDSDKEKVSKIISDFILRYNVI